MLKLYEFWLMLPGFFRFGMASVFLLHLAILLPSSTYAKTDVPFTLRQLDEALSLRKEYVGLRENKIAITKDSLRKAVRSEEKFRLQQGVFDLYLHYQLDSALVYADRMLHLSKTGLHTDLRYRAEALLQIARVYAVTGKYDECAKILDDDVFLTSTLPDSLKERYFAVQLALNRGLYEIKHEREMARIGIQSSLDSLVFYTPKNSRWYPVNLSNKLRAEEDYDKALAVLLEVYPKLTFDDPEMGSVVYFMSLLYRFKGDKERGKQFLILSSIMELQSGRKSYTSLWELAPLLYEEGDVETAHRLIEVSLQDAMYSGAYRWVLKIQRILPKIYQAYNAKVIQQRDQITAGAFVIGGLLSVMVLLVFFVLWQNKKLLKAKEVLNQTNNELFESNSTLNAVGKELHLRNAELQLANSQLLFLNKELVEMNIVKETYLSKFIDLCSEYIDKLDIFRVDLKRLMQKNKYETVLRALQSTNYIEDEFKLFLANFDETFLKIYPSFVDEFNRLFPEGEKQTLKNNELLNTELRIFALIRLGISDSNKIAKFLRCSITTVYTYRSKVKNKSLCPDEFEDRIMECSREEILL